MNQDKKLIQYRQITNTNSNNNKNNELNALSLFFYYPCSKIQEPIGYTSDEQPLLHEGQFRKDKLFSGRILHAKNMMFIKGDNCIFLQFRLPASLSSRMSIRKSEWGCALYYLIVTAATAAEASVGRNFLVLCFFINSALLDFPLVMLIDFIVTWLIDTPLFVSLVPYLLLCY